MKSWKHDEVIRGFMNRMLYEEVIPTLALDKDDLMQFAAAVEDRFNNPFVNHELMSISVNSTSKWKARNMLSFLGYIEEKKELPVCRRPAGNEYTVSDDRWVLEFYEAHKDDSEEAMVHAVPTNTQMWDQDLTPIEGPEAAVVAGLKKIRTEGAKAAYQSCL